MDDCKNLIKEDLSVGNNDIFDHPSYKCICGLTGQNVITYIHCNEDRCKYYNNKQGMIEV